MEKLYGNIRDNLESIRSRIGDAFAKYGRDPGGVYLMAVTKTVPAHAVNEAIACGVRLLGENKAQELCAKFPDYHKQDVGIHFIGRLQTNKVRQIVDKVDMVHSVDSLKLAAEIDRQSTRLGRRMQVLIEVNVGGEDSKTGVEPSSLEQLAREIALLPGVKLCGLMTIPPFSDNILQNERHFSMMQQLFVDIRAKKIDNVHMDVLSMGMSGDYVQAIKHGANIIRLGTAIFGGRNYAVS